MTAIRVIFDGNAFIPQQPVSLPSHSESMVYIEQTDSPEQLNPWIRSLRNWADSHTPLAHTVDDSRESIYSGMVDDPR